jgi:hypothetical protein
MRRLFRSQGSAKLFIHLEARGHCTADTQVISSTKYKQEGPTKNRQKNSIVSKNT